ncbi:pseudouridine synthase [Parabacteroides sp. HGS0025]|uniref:pseudouridine synthase n=1 Tax=Parabacteroides sp. HGS0025 TaxID=1078087 RepID=UPI0006171B5C|nr:pseudouridine synthase [Parabacteroides sp. HGS0025]KKB52333.1 pseudouridine synthase [Parabacteroides sp. HGS0025]
MSTEERDESQPRPRKVIPSIRRENTDQEGERKPYNQGYNRPEGNNYERRPYNRPSRDDRGGYNSYGDNRSSYGDRPSRPRTYDNREGGGYNSRPSYNNRDNNRGGYSNNREGGYNSNREGGYSSNREGGYNRPSYGNNRPSYGNNDRSSYGNNDRSYGGGGGFNRPSRPNYDERPGRAYSASPEGDAAGDGMKKRRPRVGDTRVNSYDSRDNRGGGRPSYGNNNRGGGYGNNSGYGNRRPGGQQRRTNDYNPNAKYNFQKQLKYKEVLADPNEPIRLNKFLSNAGVCSRREADEFITAGNVKVNDVVVTELGTKITRQDKVEFNEKTVQIESKVYIVLNKPKNCVTTSDDPQERLTVMDLVKNACQERIYPVGRLDRNTTGVLLLTNDGDLASKLTHPSFKKKKIYHVWLDKNVSIEDMEKIANGLELEDGEIHADAISYASEDDKSQVGIEIHSGRNRIVRRIFESLGYHVTKLDRVYFAGLTKRNLGRGKWRYLNEREVNALRMGAFE